LEKSHPEMDVKWEYEISPRKDHYELSDTVTFTIKIFNLNKEKTYEIEAITDIIPLGFKLMTQTIREYDTNIIQIDSTIKFNPPIKLCDEIKFNLKMIAISDHTGYINPEILISQTKIPSKNGLWRYEIRYTASIYEPLVRNNDITSLRTLLSNAIETLIMRKIMELLKTENVQIYGAPGAGKTIILAYIAEKTNGIYVNAETKDTAETLLLYIIYRALEKLTQETAEIKSMFLKIEKHVKALKREEAKYALRGIMIDLLEKIAKSKTFLMIDSLDKATEEIREEVKELVKILKNREKIGILAASRREEKLGIKTVEVTGFTIEEALEYLKEYQPEKEAVEALPKPILPIYLYYLKELELKRKSIEKFTKEIAERLPKSVEEWHEQIWNNLNEEEKTILKLIAMFPEKPDLVAIAHAINKKYEEVAKIIREENIRYLLKPENDTIFHDLFKEYITKKTEEYFAQEYAEKIAEHYKETQDIEKEAYFLTKTKKKQHKERFLEIWYQAFEKMYITGKYKTAQKTLKHALKIYEEIGNKLGMATALGNIGLVLMDLGEPQKALEYHQKALKIDEELGNKLGMAQDLGNIGLVLMDLGEPQKALEHFRMAKRLAVEYPNVYVVVCKGIVYCCVAVHCWLDVFNEFVELFTYAIKMYSQDKGVLFRRVWLDFFGFLDYVRENDLWGVVAEHFDVLIDFFRKIGDNYAVSFLKVIKRVAELGGCVSDEIRGAVTNLPEFFRAFLDKFFAKLKSC